MQLRNISIAVVLIAFLALDAFAQFPGGGGTRGRSGGGRQQGGMPRGEAQQANKHRAATTGAIEPRCVLYTSRNA